MQRPSPPLSPPPVPSPVAGGRPPLGRILLAGGGTGGHVFPALAVGVELRARGWEVSFVGRPGSLEARLATEAAFPLRPVAALPLVGRGPVAKARALATLAAATWTARRLVREPGTAVVVGTGGYVAAPAVIAARLAGRPALLVEPNARPGAANRWLSRLATRAAAGYPSALPELRCPAVVTGVPVRPEFFAVPPTAPGGGRRILVLGGSQGAREINERLPQALATLAARRWSGLPGLVIVHQCGPGRLEETRAAYAVDAAGVTDRPGGPTVELVPFIADVAGAMAAASLVISRAGAVTLAEIGAAGRPALLAPLALAGRHQEENARALAAAGAAATLAPGAPAAAWADAIAGLLDDPERLATMARAARALARPGAAAAIADEVEALAAGGPAARAPREVRR